MDRPQGEQMGVGTAEQEILQDGDRLFRLPEFYAEFMSLPQHSGVVDHMYVLKDRGLLTADRRTFASPFREITFVFREPSEGLTNASKVTVSQPSFGHRKRSDPFHGWVIGIRSAPSSSLPSIASSPPFADCQSRLAHAISGRPSSADVLAILDQFL